MKMKKILSGFLATAIASSSLLFAGCTNYMKSKDVMVTIGNEKITMDTMRPFVAIAEVGQEFQDLNMSYWYSQMGMSYNYSTWESEEDVEKMKDATMDSFVESYIMYKEALKKGGYEEKITADIENKFKDNAKVFLDACSEEMKDKGKLEENEFVEYQKMIYISTAYKEDLKDGYGIKKDDVKDDVDYDNQYRQYKTTYYHIPTVKTEEDGTQTALSDDDKKKAKETMEEVLDMIDDDKSKEDIQKKYKDVQVEEKDFTQADAYPDKVPKKDEDKDKKEDTEQSEQQTEPDEYIKEACKLKKGKHSKVIEYADNYAIAVMDDDDSKEAYDTAIDEAIQQKITDKYNAELEQLKASDDYKVETSETWKKIKFGELVIDRDEFDKAEGKLKKKGSN